MINIKTLASKYGLKNYNYLKSFNNIDNLYIQIQNLPEVFSSGNCSFLLYIDESKFKNKSLVLLLCIDNNGNNMDIYDSQIMLDQLYRIIVKSTPNTPNGIAKIYISGILLNSNKILYIKNIIVNKLIKNNSIVRYSQLPQLTFSATSSKQSIVSSSTHTMSLNPNSVIYNPKNNSYIVNTDCSNDNFVILNGSYYKSFTNSELKGSKFDVLNKSSILVFVDTNLVDLKYFASETLNISCLNASIITTSSISNNILNISINNFKPACGYIDAVNVYYRKKSQFDQLLYALLSQNKVLNQLLLYYDKATRKSAGNFTTSSNDYWDISADYLLTSLIYKDSIKFVKGVVLYTKTISLMYLLQSFNYKLKYTYRIQDCPDDTILLVKIINTLTSDLFTIDSISVPANCVSQLLDRSIIFSPYYFNATSTHKYKLKFLMIGDYSTLILSNISVKYDVVLYLNDNIYTTTMIPPVSYAADLFDFKILFLDTNNSKCYDYIYANNINISSLYMTITTGSIGGWTITLTDLNHRDIYLSTGNSAIYIGSGSYNNIDTPFYADAFGQFSLMDRLTFSGSLLTVQGTISSSAGNIAGWTLSGSNIIKSNLTGSVSMNSDSQYWLLNTTKPSSSGTVNFSTYLNPYTIYTQSISPLNFSYITSSGYSAVSDIIPYNSGSVVNVSLRYKYEILLLNVDVFCEIYLSSSLGTGSSYVFALNPDRTQTINFLHTVTLLNSKLYFNTFAFNKTPHTIDFSQAMCMFYNYSSSILKFNPMVLLSNHGLFVFNSPSSYFKAGYLNSGVPLFLLSSKLLVVQNLTVTGDLYTNGTIHGTSVQLDGTTSNRFRINTDATTGLDSYLQLICSNLASGSCKLTAVQTAGIVNYILSDVNFNVPTLNCTSLNLTSLRLIKKDIFYLNPFALINKINKLNPVTYKLKLLSNSPTFYGLIAELLLEIYPLIVSYDNNGSLSGIQYQRLTIPIISMLQYLYIENKILKLKFNKMDEYLNNMNIKDVIKNTVKGFKKNK